MKQWGKVSSFRDANTLFEGQQGLDARNIDSWSFSALIWLLGSGLLAWYTWSDFSSLIGSGEPRESNYFNVTSGRKRCSNGTPIIKKVQTLPFYQRRNNERRKRKTKVLTLNKYMAMGSNGARCQEWLCWLVAGSKLLLCSADARSERAGWLPAVS
jgi:hypothetical protein